MSGITSTYSSVAVIVRRGRSERVTVASSGAYTCPPNTTAEVSGTMNLDATGADAVYAIAVKRNDDSVYYPVGPHVIVNQVSAITGIVVMHQGDILTFIGDAGSTTATCDMDASIKEVQE